mmetsp:Transcript_56041/g.131149  ORF Transcript_56041/g.131149 Transcript_56041/m.131149 type:complete len:207 (+) Transcript_56041:675-1295(+)
MRALGNEPQYLSSSCPAVSSRWMFSRLHSTEIVQRKSPATYITILKNTTVHINDFIELPMECMIVCSSRTICNQRTKRTKRASRKTRSTRTQARPPASVVDKAASVICNPTTTVSNKFHAQSPPQQKSSPVSTMRTRSSPAKNTQKQISIHRKCDGKSSSKFAEVHSVCHAKVAEFSKMTKGGSNVEITDRAPFEMALRTEFQSIS